MALANYTDLKKSVIDWSHRGDLDLLIDDFILMAETEMMSNNSSSLSVRNLESTTTTVASTVSRFIALPSNYKSMRSVRIDKDGFGELSYKTPQAMTRRDNPGQPLFFTVRESLEFDVIPDIAYNIEMSFYATQAALTSLAPTNSILTRFPNIYLFGCLWAAFTYANDEDEAQKYYSRFIRAIQGANKEDRKGRFGPNPMSRVEGSTP
jgi:hypothetical protein